MECKISKQLSYKMILSNYPDVMDISQVCKALGISTKTGYKLLKEGRLLSIKVGRTYRIPKAFVFSYLKIWG